MKISPFYVLTLLLLIGCSSKQPKQEKSQEVTKWEHYTGSWFEFDYPAYMQIDEIRNEISDSISGLKEGGDVVIYGEYLPLRMKFTKSCMFDVFESPEQWRDLSIETKFSGMADNADSYLGVYEEQDSIDFKGNPAASVTFAVLEDNDTIVHHQLVVMKKLSKDLFYLNVIAPKDKYHTYINIADSILKSIALK